MKVTTQEELDAALAAGESFVDIYSPAGVWLEVRASGSSTVTASGSSTVTAYGSSTVTASGSSTVTAYGSSTVTAYDSSTVRAYDSSTVTAYDSSTVTAYGSSTVTAYDSSTVTAYGSSTVTAYGSSTVTAYGSSTVTASSYVAVHLHSARVTLEGGVVIDVTELDRSKLDVWAGYHGATIDGDEIILFKAVDADLKSGRHFSYPLGEYVEAPDWKPGDFCGNGLHFSPHPHQALDYFPDATRFLKVAVKTAEMSIIDGNAGGTPKVKARGARVLSEVTIDGVEVTR